MGIYQDLAKIERIQAKSQKRVNRFMQRVEKRGRVRIGIIGVMCLTMDMQILKLASSVLDRVELKWKTA